MKSNLFKEQKRRNIYKKNEKPLFISYGFSYLDSHEKYKTIKNHALNDLKLNKTALKSKIHNRCILTGRSRSIFRKFKISRMALRTLVSSKRITGLSKIS